MNGGAQLRWGVCSQEHRQEVGEIRAQQDADLARLEAERDAVRATAQLESMHLRQYLDQQVPGNNTPHACCTWRIVWECLLTMQSLGLLQAPVRGSNCGLVPNG